MSDAPEPAVCLIASGTERFSERFGVPAHLGRRIRAGHVPERVFELPDERMSREHATVRFLQAENEWTITDHGSRNGTYVDGEKIEGGERRIKGRAVLRTGHTVFLLLPDGTGYPVDGDHGPTLTDAYARLRERAATTTVLALDSEVGNAKARAARAFHDASPRKDGPFIAVACGALPAVMGERLLFGAKSPGFSGSTRSIGHLQMADTGTLFLDEVADLDRHCQARLLHVIQEREVIPVGANVGSPVNLAIVVASRHELQVAVDTRSFRGDLFDALVGVTVGIPPLREREHDIARIVQREAAIAGLEPHAKLIETCCLRWWPGNESELEHAIREAARRARVRDALPDVLRVEDLADHAGLSVGPEAGETAVERPKIKREQIDRPTIVAALERAHGVVSVAARSLGLHRTEVYRFMETFDIERGGTG